jgi:hypothetical protein
MREIIGNVPVYPGIFLHYLAPIVRNAPELCTARCGMPSSQFALAFTAWMRTSGSQRQRPMLWVNSICLIPSAVNARPSGLPRF